MFSAETAESVFTWCRLRRSVTQTSLAPLAVTTVQVNLKTRRFLSLRLLSYLMIILPFPGTALLHVFLVDILHA